MIAFPFLHLGGCCILLFFFFFFFLLRKPHRSFILSYLTPNASLTTNIISLNPSSFDMPFIGLIRLTKPNLISFQDLDPNSYFSYHHVRSWYHLYGSRSRLKWPIYLSNNFKIENVEIIIETQIFIIQPFYLF